MYERLFESKEKEKENLIVRSSKHSNDKKTKSNTTSSRHESKDRDTSVIRDITTSNIHGRKRSITPKRTNSATVKPRKTSDRSFNIEPLN